MKINRRETVLIIRALELYRDVVKHPPAMGRDVEGETQKLLAKIRVELERRKHDKTR